MLSVMSPVDGIGQVKGIELMVKCELPRRYIAVDSLGGPERGTFVHSDWRPVLAPAAIRVDSILTYHITPTTYESAYQTRRLPVTTLIYVTSDQFHSTNHVANPAAQLEAQ